MTIRRFVGVYDADGTLLGEVAYVVRHQVGRAHCALCDVTHGRLRQKARWREVSASLGAPFETFHRNDQPAWTRRLASPPLVAAELDDGTHRLLLGRRAIEACAGDPDRLVAAILAAATS